jgi:hypothetical protein
MTPICLGLIVLLILLIIFDTHDAPMRNLTRNAMRTKNYRVQLSQLYNSRNRKVDVPYSFERTERDNAEVLTVLKTTVKTSARLALPEQSIHTCVCSRVWDSLWDILPSSKSGADQTENT